MASGAFLSNNSDMHAVQNINLFKLADIFHFRIFIVYVNLPIIDILHTFFWKIHVALYVIHIY